MSYAPPLIVTPDGHRFGELPLCVTSFPIDGGESAQRPHIERLLRSAPAGSAVVLPEYAAFTDAGSRDLLPWLCDIARERRLLVMTTLNLSSSSLPASDGARHNAQVVIDAAGTLITPQAKITPQSFEMHQPNPKLPQMDIAPYGQFNIVTLAGCGPAPIRVLFAICSDLFYLCRRWPKDVARVDWIICCGNFGAMAERAAARVLRYNVRMGYAKAAVLANAAQVSVAEGRLPLMHEARVVLTRATLDALDEPNTLLAENYALYDGTQMTTFMAMVALTRAGLGRFTVPESRAHLTVPIIEGATHQVAR